MSATPPSTSANTGNSWSWRLEAADGSEVDAVSVPPQTSQSDAESWLGEHWRELADQRVAQVTLLNDGSVVYGPMSLEPVDDGSGG